MVSRQEEYTRRLEEQALELERAHNQAITACKIVREISALQALPEMGATLIGKLQETMRCRHIALLVFNTGKDCLSVVSHSDHYEIKDEAVLKIAEAALAGANKLTFSRKNLLKPPLVPEDFPAAERQALIPFDDGQVGGAIVIACPEGSCSQEELELVRVIVGHNAGALRRAMQHEEEVSALRGRVDAAAGFGDLIGKDPKMQVVYKLIEDVAPSDATVLIQGESGTGKELVARAIHAHSPRAPGPFVVINCSAYPATLLESELFGHEKGAFTGALRQKAGRFEQAHGGTVFLDEIGEIPPPAQIKLLRVLQTRKFERLGGEQTLTVDVRILAATHKDLLEEVKKGTFREDLFYRLNVIPIILPPPGPEERHSPAGAPFPAPVHDGAGQRDPGVQLRGHAPAPGLLLARQRQGVGKYRGACRRPGQRKPGGGLGLPCSLTFDLDPAAGDAYGPGDASAPGDPGRVRLEQENGGQASGGQSQHGVLHDQAL